MNRLTAEFRQVEVARYIGALHAPDAHVAVALIAPDGAGPTLHRFVRAAELAEERWLRYLAYRNAAGQGVYLTACPLREGAQRRTRELVRCVTSVWLDLDRDVEASLGLIARDLPPSTVAVQTSPGRLQLVWRLESPLDVDEGEALLRGLALAFGGDRAATDASRVLRLPGFVNTKYPELALSRRIVRIAGGSGLPVSADSFLCYRQRRNALSVPVASRTKVRAINPGSGATPPEIAGDADLVRLWSGRGRTAWDEDRTASERDLALAHGLRKFGVAPTRAAEILASSPNRASGRRKSDLAAYLALTLSRAGLTM